MAVGGRRSPMRIEMPESRFADLDGPVHFVEWDGPPGRTIVLVHGLGGSLLSWLAVAPGLAKHGRVLALDLPGFGRSDRGGRRSRVSDLRTTVSRFIDEVADGGPVVLVGNSMGGFISAEVAIAQPEWVERLMLVSAAGMSHVHMRREPAEALAHDLAVERVGQPHGHPAA